MLDAGPLYLRAAAGGALMAYRDRSCGHLQPRKLPAMPPARQIAPLAPLMYVLMECASEYEASSDDGELTSAVDFATWLDVEVQRAAQFGVASPVNAQREAASAANRTPIRLHSTKKVAP